MTEMNRNMDAEKFVQNVRLTIENVTIEQTIQQLVRPAGRKPKVSLVKQSDWYNSLSQEDRDNVKAILIRSVETTIFGFFCALDGVIKISDDGLLELREVHSETGKSKIISDGNFGDLHDIYLSFLENEEAEKGRKQNRLSRNI